MRDTSSDTASTEIARTNTILWVLWATYGSFYFCRTNLSAAVPGMLEEFAADGITKSDLGTVLASLKLAYGVGQFVNGQIAERISPKFMLAVGLLLSAALNVLFGFGTAIWFFTFVWAMNGYVQALGWTPTMRVAANWLPPLIRGKSIGIIGTGYMVGASLSYVVAGWAADQWGWRAALYVPSTILVASCIHMLILLRASPGGDSSLQTRNGRGPGTPSVGAVLRYTLGNVDLWLLAIALGLLNACRYGFLDWGVALIHDEQGGSVGKAAIKFAILPAGGILGSFGAGWLTDRMFGGRRAPVICGMLVLLAILTLLFQEAVAMGTGTTICLLVLIGIMIFGPQVLLVGTAPADLARAGTVAASVGFVNFMGYMGAAAGDKLTGAVADRGWSGVYYLWSAWALVAASAVAVLWRKTAVGERSK